MMEPADANVEQLIEFNRIGTSAWWRSAFPDRRPSLPFWKFPSLVSAKLEVVG
jgi:hypothetical protein